MDDHPSVDSIFILNLLEKKSYQKEVVGETVSFIKPGTSPIFKRVITINTRVKNLSFNQAMGIAIKTNLINEVSSWLREEKKWDGDYLDN